MANSRGGGRGAVCALRLPRKTASILMCFQAQLINPRHRISAIAGMTASSEVSMRDDYALRAIAEHGSFTRAAAALDVTASALSQTLRQLETQLGTRLLHRTTRRVGLSEAGQELLQRIAPALNELDAAMDALRQHGDRPAGLLRLTVPDVVAIALLD